MKVSKIQFKNYLNFQENLVLDFTYPMGHQKAGQPLEKVCFIGQSGTGKTSLLNLIKYFSFEHENTDKECLSEELIVKNVKIFYDSNGRNFYKTVSEEKKFEYHEGEKLQNDQFVKLVYSQIDSKPWLINFPYNVIEISYFQNEKQVGIEQNFDKEVGILVARKDQAKSKKIWDFSVNNVGQLWDIVFDEISAYKIEFLKQKNLCFDSILNDRANVDKYVNEFDNWRQNNFNPIESIAHDCLNKILNKFNIEVKTEIDFEKYINSDFITLKHKNSVNSIPYPFHSTGTKQVILTAIPLYFLKPKNAIILFDQPESSLYPDIQQIIIDEYRSLTENCQFFYSTHSPIIASSFQPWEIFELHFDPVTGKVDLKPNYKNERHVDNYLSDAQLLPWEQIYTTFFGLNDEGNEKTRKPKLKDLAHLKRDFEKLNKSDPATRKEKFAEIKQLAEKLGIDMRVLMQRADAEN